MRSAIIAVLALAAATAVFAQSNVDVEAESPWVRVPGGRLIHRECVYSVESGFVVKDLKPCPYRAPQQLPEDQIYAIDVHYTPANELMTSMNASFTAPTLPAQDDGQVLYYWPGFKSTAPTMGLPVLQPVLQYGTDCCGGGQYWCVRSWFVYGNIDVAVVSTETPVSPGDRVDSQMTYDTATSMWTINAVNSKTGQNTTLFISYEAVYSTDFHVAMLVNEIIMDETECADLPPSGSITFTNVNVNGKAIKWTDRIQSSYCKQAINDKSTTVTFSWDSKA